MSEQSNIAWTDSTHNFWRGCTKVSPGCQHCYAEGLVTARLGGEWGPGKPRVRSKDFDAPLRWNKKPWVCDGCGKEYSREHGATWCACPTCRMLHDPMKSVPLRRRRVFSLSLGDWLDPEVPIEWLADMLDVIRRCPNLDWLLCTKRPELWKQRLLWVNGKFAHDGDLEHYETCPKMQTAFWIADWLAGKPPGNVMLLASVENQEMADKRIPELLKIPAWRRGLSCEPLLGPLDLCSGNLCSGNFKHGDTAIENLDWVIVGGESGPKARPCHVDWIRSIRDQCRAAGVPCFVKQLGSRPSLDGSEAFWTDRRNHHPKWADPSEWPEDLRVQEFYK